jgi:hypothetical protein
MTSIRQFYLLKLAEECSEIAQQACKQIQFGHYAFSKSTGKVYDNTALLRAEVNDFLAMLDVLIDLEELPEISPEELLLAKNKKRSRVIKYLQNSQELGLVEKDFALTNKLERDFKNYGAAQSSCLHKHVDKPGSYFGETCLDCGLYLNNGA